MFGWHNALKTNFLRKTSLNKTIFLFKKDKIEKRKTNFMPKVKSKINQYLLIIERDALPRLSSSSKLNYAY